jgi:hypothetical protein
MVAAAAYDTSLRDALLLQFGLITTQLTPDCPNTLLLLLLLLPDKQSHRI